MCYIFIVDPLLRSSIELNAAKTPGERLREALEMMDWGIAMKRSRLRAENPDASPEAIDEMLTAWLARDD
jgi:hypothetical protein